MPHSKVIATGIMCLAVLGSIMIYTNRNYLFNGRKAIIGAPQVTVDTTAGTSISNDDWKKLLNISVASSGPIEIIGQPATTDDTNNITAQLSKNFFTLYLQDQKNGVAIDQNEADKIAQEAISGISVLPNTKTYGTNDIRITADTSTASKIQYETAMAHTLTNSTLQNKQNEIAILSTATKSQNQTDLDKLDPIIAGYQKLIHETLLVTVPADNVGTHLVYLNALSAILSDINGLKQLLNDPVAGYVAFTLYQKDVTKLGLVSKTMNTYFGR